MGLVALAIPLPSAEITKNKLDKKYAAFLVVVQCTFHKSKNYICGENAKLKNKSAVEFYKVLNERS